MNKHKRQPISEVAIMIMDDIDSRLNKMNNHNNLSDIKNEIAELKEMIVSAKKVLTLIERINQQYGDSNDR